MNRECQRCSDRGVLHPREDVFDWCPCVLGTVLKQQSARWASGAPELDFSAFYAQRALSFERRDNTWRPFE